MFNKRTATWFGIGILGLAIHHLSPTIPLLGIGVTVHSIGSEGCSRVNGPVDFRFCEHAIRSTTEKGVAYVACDPIRDLMNPVMDVEVLEDLTQAKTGSIWRLNYSAENPQPEKMVIRGAPSVANDLHPLGIAFDFDQENQKSYLIAANLPVQGAPHSLEIFNVVENADQEKELVHIRTINRAIMNAPNSIHIIKDSRFRSSEGIPSFFVTNDHHYTNDFMKILENYLLLPVSGVYFYDARVDTLTPVLSDLVFANGIAGDDTVLFTAETNHMAVRQYKIKINDNKDQENGHPTIALEYVSKKKFPMAVDNLSYDSSTKEMIVAGHPKALQLLQYVFSNDKQNLGIPPSLVMAWDIKDDSVKKLFSDDGKLYGGSTTGFRDTETNTLVISSLLDSGLLICPAKD
ncbi:hypothetical protein CLU79DRAFT_764551 [Phycomyces nitens]|nr:hypothetical protein CLU79DRAFT_764551 [Phycomyces nitens]